MKIIEGQVKIPSSTVISTEMRNVILWLLQKDPNARPSIKHILNEVNQMRPHPLMPHTEHFSPRSSPNFFLLQQSVREKLRKDNFELPEELREARITDGLTNPNFEAKANMKKKGSNLQMLAQRNQEETKAAVAAGNTGTPNSGGIADPDGPNKRTPLSKQRSVGKDQLRAAGDPASPKNLTAAMNGAARGAATGTGSRPVSYRGGSSSAADGTTTSVQGNRVRGPGNRRAPSEKALSRHQVRPASIRGSDNQSKHEGGAESPGDQDGSEQADAKDGGGGSEYEEDFDDYEGENDWEEDEDAPTAALNASRLPPAGPHSVHPHPHGHANGHGAEDKPHHRPELSRTGTAKDDDWEDDKSEFAAPSRGQSMRGNAFSESGDPFHQTDESVAHMNHMGTLGSDANTWEPVWTQKRGLIDNTSRIEGGEAGSADLGVGLYQEVLEGVQEAEEELEDTGRNSDLTDGGSGAEPAMFMIEEARSRAVGILGEELFWKVYDLCTKQMSKVKNESDQEDGKISPSDQAFLKVLCGF